MSHTIFDTRAAAILYDEPRTIFARIEGIKAEVAHIDLSNWQTVEKVGSMAVAAFSHPSRISNVATRMDCLLHGIVRSMKNACDKGADTREEILEMIQKMEHIACSLSDAPEEMMYVAYSKT